MDVAKLRLLNQHLLRPQMESPRDVVAHFGMMQAQDYEMCLRAVALRLRRPSREAVVEAVSRGEIVMLHLARCTWQLATAEDVRWLSALYGAGNERAVLTFERQQKGILTPQIVAESDALLLSLLKGKALTMMQIVPEYAAIGVQSSHTVRHLVTLAEAHGLVCNGPVAGRERTYALLDERVPCHHPAPEDPLRELADRYFRSHGPATLQDFVWWSGLGQRQCQSGINALGSSLLEQDGYYLHQASRSGRMDSRLTLLLPPYDEILIGYKDRTPILPRQWAHKAHNRTGLFYPVVLHGREIDANWNRKTQEITPFSSSISR